MHSILEIRSEVQKALNANSPVVALESALISHGLSYPQNLETAQALEQAVRENGAVPATIAIIEGKIRVGLTEGELWPGRPIAADWPTASLLYRRICLARWRYLSCGW